MFDVCSSLCLGVCVLVSVYLSVFEYAWVCACVRQNNTSASNVLPNITLMFVRELNLCHR